MAEKKGREESSSLNTREIAILEKKQINLKTLQFLLYEKIWIKSGLQAPPLNTQTVYH